MSAAISPDGKYLAYSDQTAIHQRSIQTGETRLLPQSAGYRVQSWFPDGTRLAAVSQGTSGGQEGIFVVSMLGGAPRKIQERASGSVRVSPDGSKIAFLLQSEPGTGDFTRHSGPSEIWTMGPNGEEPTILHTLSAGDYVINLSWSPDGQRVAWGRFRRELNAAHSFLETRGLDGGRITTLATEKELPGGVFAFTWLKDGRVLCYLRELPPRDRDWNLWEIPTNVKTGQAAGPPKRLSNWEGANVGNLSVGYLTASADGKKLTFLKYASQSDVSIGELEAGGTKMRPPRRLTLDESNDVPTAWMPNSKAVLFHSDRTGHWAIFKQEIDKNSAEAVVSGEGDLVTPRVSADQQWILYVSEPRPASATSTRQYRLMRIPIMGGPPQTVFEAPRFFNVFCTRPPVNFCMWIERQATENVVFTFDPLKGKGRELFRTELGSGEPNVSFDGQRFAYVVNGRRKIRILNALGQPVRDLSVDGWEGLNSLDWSADGKGLYVGLWTPKAGTTLLYIELDGRVHPLWQQPGNLRTWGTPSPDGRYLAILSGTTDSSVWMVEGF